MYAQCVNKLSKDQCYPVEVTQQFQNIQNKVTLDFISPAYELIQPLLNSFNGDTEKFYPKFYKLFIDSENYNKDLDRHCSLMLSFEVANNVLAHLAGATFHDDVLEFDDSSSDSLSDKDMSLISYLAGYVFGTFYRRIRFSKSGNYGSFYHQQCLSFLMAGKIVDESMSMPEHQHVEVLNRGGLWKVTSTVTSIFKIVECYFKNATQNSTSSI